MTGLPKLPGLTFNDPTITKFHLNHHFDFINGFRYPRHSYYGVGNRIRDIGSADFIEAKDTVRYDPVLTYGQSKAPLETPFVPHYVLYDQKCLTFKAFFKQSVAESPVEHYRVRHVNIMYFLEDDTLTVLEPEVKNSGIPQGKLIQRGKIPKFETGGVWHWKDLNIGIDIAMYGIVYHIVDCDLFTREYMASQGIDLNAPEDMPPDPYIQQREMLQYAPIRKTPLVDDKLRRFLEYDGKVLKFWAVWDDRDAEYGEMRPYLLLYYLSDDNIAVKEIHERNSGRDPFPMLLRKTKLPKIWTDRPITYPSLYLELSDEEVTEYYQPIDLIVGETIFVLGRRFMLYDCDDFTRKYYIDVLGIKQPAAIEVFEKPAPPPEKPFPPHDGIGSLEDSLQSCMTFQPKPPKRDEIKEVLNAGKVLRYTAEMDWVHPEDQVRQFVLLYSLGNSTVNVFEPPVRNSGITGGKFLRNNRIPKPGSDPLNPEYYTPADFYIGAIVEIFKHRFRITGADLYVYRYMQANPEKFPPQVIDNIRNFMFNQGYLKDEIEEQMEKDLEMRERAEGVAISEALERPETELEKCLAGINIKDRTYSVEGREGELHMFNQPDKPYFQEKTIPPYGIKEADKTCPYPVDVGQAVTTECEDVPETTTSTGDKVETFTPKHVDTEEEKVQKHYLDVLNRHREVCSKSPWVDPQKYKPAKPYPLLVSPEPKTEKNIQCRKPVTFADTVDRCLQDRDDLCNLAVPASHEGCTDYDRMISKT